MNTDNGFDTQYINSTEYGGIAQSESLLPEETEVDEEEQRRFQKIKLSNERVKALSTLRSATAPKDKSLDKTANLPGDARLGKPLPAPAETVKTTKEYTRQEPHPWHRFFARTLDGFVALFIMTVPPLFVQTAYSIFGQGRIDPFLELAGVITTGVLALISALLYEPMMLSLFATTIGKGLFKIKITEARTGEHLTFGRAVARTLWVYWYSGQILSIVPVVGFIAPFAGHIMQYKKLVRDKITSYDERMKIRYQHN